MKAIVLAAHGGPEAFALEERPAPAPGPGEIVVANEAVGLNFIDVYQRKGLYPVGLPAVLGSEGAGRVVAAGKGAAFREGARVAYIAGAGGYAEQTLVLPGMAAALPDAISAPLAASCFLKGLTAEMLAQDVYPLREGRVALVHAAAGGVGTLLVQRAAGLGARVIAVVGAAEKSDVARRAGAADVIIRTERTDLARRVRELTDGRGVDVVYDSVGAATFEASLDSLAMRGMMVSYGNASGPVPPVAPLELSRRGSLFLTRPSLFHYATPERLPAMAARLFDLIAKGALAPAPPAAFPLERIADAHRLLESRQSTGSIVLTP